MGVENAETIQIIANAIGVFIAVLAGLCFWVGIMNPDKIQPLTFKAPEIDDEDLFAIATGDEDYLEAHCVLKKDSEVVASVSKTEAQLEKEELQKMRNKVARMKLQKQLDELEKPQKEKTQTNPLIADCIDALVSMGEKKSVARATVNKYFATNPDTKSLEEFLSGVFK